jgi:hypothetical protein
VSESDVSCFGYAGHSRVHQKPIGLRLSLADAVQYNSTFRLRMSNTATQTLQLWLDNHGLGKPQLGLLAKLQDQVDDLEELQGASTNSLVEMAVLCQLHQKPLKWEKFMKALKPTEEIPIPSHLLASHHQDSTGVL